MTDSVGVFIAFTAGILSFLSPCVLPLVPSYLSFITGMSLEDLQEGVDRRATMIHSLLFVLGFTIIFVALGASASFLGQFLRYYEVWIARVGGVIIILLGIHLTGLIQFTKLMGEARVHLKDKPAGYMGTLAVGIAFGAGWTPCIGPVLGAILTYAASQDQFWSGVSLLTVYSAGLAVPFLASAAAVNWFLETFKSLRKYLMPIQIASGVLLIFLGVLLVTGSFTILSSYLIQFTPDWLLERM
jgi:cytochrome c-type biogenesis protein